MTYIILQQILEGVLSLFIKDPEFTPSGDKKSLTIILPMYLPNEQNILFDTLDYYRGLNYEGGYRVILAFNTPVTMRKIEDEIEEYYWENSDWFSYFKVPNSTTKAHNLNYVLTKSEEEGICLGDMIALFDADGHPEITNFDRANYWLFEKGMDYVQGRCKVRTNGSLFDAAVGLNFSLMYQVCHRFRYGVFGYALFGGSNGYWKKEALQNILFDTTMLTEDIDCAVRAMKMGYKGVYDNSIVSSEEAPPTFWDFFVQRTRWAQGWFEVSLKHFKDFFTLSEYTWYQRAHIVNLFIIRELISHVKLLCLPLLLAEYLRKGTIVFDAFGTFVLAYATIPYFVQTLAGYFATPTEYWDPKNKWKLLPILLSLVFYTFIESVIVLRGQIQHYLGMNRWIATPRSG